MQNKQIAEFKKTVNKYYKTHARLDLPWRQLSKTSEIDPYSVMVSEIMLQQTQVQRVVPKFTSFMARFPSTADLAAASLSEVLIEWSGLGYNRRAKFLHQAAIMVQTEMDGIYPHTVAEFEKLPGIGKNTAAAIVVYSFNVPVVFIETNIRSVYLHHFFKDQLNIPDSKLLPIIEATLDKKNPRQWYWSLMDYGSYLKKIVTNPSRRSQHHSKQSIFNGSKRQVRGQVLQALMNGPVSAVGLQAIINDPRLKQVLSELEKEQLISKKQTQYILGK